jgi:hypothetical protein
MAFNEKTIYAATNLGDRLQGNPWFSSVGVAEEEDRPVLIVYLRRKSKAIDGLIPHVWEGIPVRLREIGKISSLSR